MTRSAYVTTSSLSVECPTCHAKIGIRCRTLPRFSFPNGAPHAPITKELARCHSARAKAAADKRTAEVHPGLVDTFEIPPEVPLSPTHPEPRILAHHKVRL